MAEPGTNMDVPDFEQIYRGETPLGGKIPWDFGAPQPVVVALAGGGGEFVGEVLDVGCGLGDNASFLASRGFRVTGVDSSPTAIERARARAASMGLDVAFAVADATKLDGYENRFDAVLDSALYHCLEAAQRREYLATLTRVTRPGARLHLLCFSSQLPDAFPTPHRFGETELREEVGQEWTVESVKPAFYTTSFTREDLEAGARMLLGGDADTTGLALMDTDADGRVLAPVWQLTAHRA
ncbi:class I SAM-dependent methyltransferase [Amycolatopsis sp. NPDC023774]|uniref:class I SAM-dependent methyltransferase n=1 Tax=Amycolatopsis sp. NPDC023774 TaxID=3155015 RepID=UPI00340B08E5